MTMDRRRPATDRATSNERRPNHHAHAGHMYRPTIRRLRRLRRQPAARRAAATNTNHTASAATGHSVASSTAGMLCRPAQAAPRHLKVEASSCGRVIGRRRPSPVSPLRRPSAPPSPRGRVATSASRPFGHLHFQFPSICAQPCHAFDPSSPIPFASRRNVSRPATIDRRPRFAPHQFADRRSEPSTARAPKQTSPFFLPIRRSLPFYFQARKRRYSLGSAHARSSLRRFRLWQRLDERTRTNCGFRRWRQHGKQHNNQLDCKGNSVMA